ncbi:LysR family transcriptional regulator ArgP [Williamsia sterculiae]|nr:LysR family transcriptional regulator ArgP [Williamsia sterculiae]
MDIDSAGLLTLAAVVREGTFDAAATALHITPSAVSQRIKTLETSVGRVLVQRSKPARTTPDGEIVLALAKQWELLSHEATARLTAVDDDADDPRDQRRLHLPIATNADSLAIWLLPVIADVQRRLPVAIEVFRDDETRSAELLRAGTVLGAVTSDANPIQGCAVTRLGIMRYLPVATPDIIDTWFAGGVDAEALQRAPMVAFDRNDALQDLMLRKLIGTDAHLRPPVTYVPASTEYHRAVELGAGWGTVPLAQIGPALRERTVRTLGDEHLDIELFWQYWRLSSPLVDELTAAIIAAAARHLE